MSGTSDLERLLADGIIDEVCGRLKSGKEADISAVRRGDLVLAAKVYKDRATRSFKNNADYKEGRKVRNSRTQRAIDSGGKFGRESEEQAWKSAEADALYKLVGSGVRIPEPVLFYEGVLLMELVAGADGQVAPRLIDVAIDPADAMGIYADLLAQMISMLCCDLIHGDLSPYNILHAADGPTIIDFPQVISAAHNTRAEFFFLRDFDNVLRFLVGFDPTLAVHRADGRAVWRAYVARELTPQFVPPPPPPPQRREERRGGQPRNDGRGRPRGLPHGDRTFDTRGDRPRGPQSTDRGPRNDGRPPDSARGARGPYPNDRGRDDGRPPSDRRFDRNQGRPPGDRTFDRNQGRPPSPGDRPRDDRGRPPGPRNDRTDRDTSPGSTGSRRDDFDWSQPRRSEPPPDRRNERPRGPAFAMPAPRPPRPRVDPRPPPPSGGHRRRPKRRS